MPNDPKRRSWLTPYIPADNTRGPAQRERAKKEAMSRALAQRALDTIGPRTKTDDLAHAVNQRLAERNRATGAMLMNPLLSGAALAGEMNPAADVRDLGLALKDGSIGGALLAAAPFIGPVAKKAGKAAKAAAHVPRIPDLPERWAVITADNPFGNRVDEAVNAPKRAELAAEIERRGFAGAQPVEGGYPDDKTGQLLTEQGLLVPGMDEATAMELGRQFGQNSVLVPGGLLSLADNALYPSRGLQLGDENIFTRLPNGDSFKMDLDFDNPQSMSSSTAVAPVQRPQAPNIIIPNEWRPTERGVFDRSGGAMDYREPRPLPFDQGAGPRARPSPISERIGGDPRVEAGLQRDVERGLRLGGRTWYGFKPIRDSYGEMGGILTFDDFVQSGAAASARNSTHAELPVSTILMYAKANGIPYAEAKRIFDERFGDISKATMMGMHGDLFDRAQRAGYMAPSERGTGSLKIPNYGHNRALGATGIPLDTHEQRRLSQLSGLDEGAVNDAIGRNSLSYNAAAAPYHRIAERLGLHPDQVQASRWLGGGMQTGLESQPSGDFVQTLEDALLYTARVQGLDESPAGLRKLWGRVSQGQDFLAPYVGTGGFPVYR